MSTLPHPALRARTRRGLVALVAAMVALALGPASSVPLALAWGAHPALSGRLAPRAKPPSATFGIGPANAKGIDGRPLLNYSASPGAQLTDRVAVLNLAIKPVRLRMYTADGVNGTDGALGYLPRANPGTGARNWITVTMPRPVTVLALGPRSKRVLPIALHVPSNAQPGDHLVGIVVSLTSKVQNKTGQRVNFEQRVALRTVIRVSGPLTPALRIEKLHASYRGTLNPFGAGTADVSFTVHNTGNVDLSGAQAITFTGTFGSTGASTKLADVPVLLPGSSYPVHARVHDVWPQIFMHARAVVTPAGVQGAADPAMTPVSASTSFAAVPWTLLALIAFLLIAAVATLMYRRRAARRRVNADGPGGPGAHRASLMKV